MLSKFDGECPFCLRDGNLLPVAFASPYGTQTIRLCSRCRTGDAARWGAPGAPIEPLDHWRHLPGVWPSTPRSATC